MSCFSSCCGCSGRDTHYASDGWKAAGKAARKRTFSFQLPTRAVPGWRTCEADGQAPAGRRTVAGGTLLFVMQGQDPSDPAARRPMTDVAQALDRSVEQSLQRVDALTPQLAQVAAQQQNQPAQEESIRAQRITRLRTTLFNRFNCSRELPLWNSR